MLRQDRNIANVKSNGLRSIMRNEGLAKIINDAWDAPVGSTKRAKAKSILKSVNSAYGNFYGTKLDGKGGPGDSLISSTRTNPEPVSDSREPNPENPTRNIVIQGYDRPSSPAVKSPAPPAETTQEFTSFRPTYSRDSINKIIEGNDPDILPGALSVSGKVGESGTQIAGGTEGYRGDPVDLSGGMISHIDKDGNYVEGPGLTISPRAKTIAPGGSRMTDHDLHDRSRNVYPYMKTSSDMTVVQPRIAARNQEEANKILENRVNDAISQGKDVSGEDLDSMIDSVEEDTGKIPVTPDTIAKVGDRISFSDAVDMANQYGVGFLDDWYAGLDDSAKGYYEDVYNAVKDGIGSKNFTWQIMSDPEKLAKMLGVPVESLKYLPQNGLLSEHLIEIRNAINDGYNLDEIQMNLMNRIDAGAHIEGDLQAFVRGKDEYLSDVDRMLFETRERMAGMDLSNPNVRSKMDNYVNYLTILKGRQNQRYIDFVQMSVNQHNAEIEHLKSIYEIASSRAEKEISDMSEITKEQFDRISEMIGGMYDTVEKMETKQREKEYMNLSLAQAGENLIRTQLENEALRQDLDDIGGSEDGMVVGTDGSSLDESSLGNLMAPGDEGDTHDPSKTNTLLGYNASKDELANFLNPFDVWSAAASSKGSIAGTTLSTYLGYAGNDIRKKLSSGNFNVIDEIIRMEEEMLNTQARMPESEKDIAMRIVSEFDRAIGNAVMSGVGSYLNNTGVSESIREAVKYLGKSRWLFASPEPTAKAKQDFIEMYPNIDSRVLSAIFDIYAQGIADGYKPEETFTYDGGDGKMINLWESPDFADQIVVDLSSKLVSPLNY